MLPMREGFALFALQDNDVDDDQQVIEIESLSPSQIVELIELSFFQACFALSKGNIEPLKLFIVAVKSSRERSASATIQAVNKSPPSVRVLDPKEQALRTDWIQAIYLVLGHLQGVVVDGIDDKISETYSPVLDDLVAIQKSGLGLNLNHFVTSRKNMLLPKPNILALDDAENDPVQLAVATQTVQVIYNTIVMLEEERKATTKDTENPKKPTNKTGGRRGFG